MIHYIYTTSTCNTLYIQVYLVDYGLAYRYGPESEHKEYKEDPRRCHDGTIEFTSIDAHKGVSMYYIIYIYCICYCIVYSGFQTWGYGNTGILFIAVGVSTFTVGRLP